jgi:hypothetical protein
MNPWSMLIVAASAAAALIVGLGSSGASASHAMLHGAKAGAEHPTN